jgi:hypothetical protein
MTDNQHKNPDQLDEGNAVQAKTTKRLPKMLRIVIAVACAVLLLGGFFVLYSYKSKPNPIRKPAFQHLHFRMQLLVDNKPIDFSEKEFQTPAGHDVCTADLTKQPIHFHDGKDQMVHIHWDGMTGGLVLKYYGWNYVGGQHGTLGVRFDQLPKLVNVPIHGNTLPQIPSNDKFYVYIGDEHGYKEKSFDDFVHKDLENFFGEQSNLPTEETSWLNKIFPKAYAHGDEHAEGATVDASQEELKKINNLIGNVIIFVQKDKPSDKQVKDRFDKLAPLSLSTCAG